MNLPETLTKENFWNEMVEKYPNATKEFCDWIDEYKKAVNWNLLFNNGATGYKEGSAFKHKLEAPKFHEIPYAFQQGIWLEFVRQTLPEYFEQVERHMSQCYDVAGDIRETFAAMEEVNQP